MNYIDAHCHLADPRFEATREQVLARARAVGIRYFLQGGVDPEDWQRQLDLRRPDILPCFGLHPWWVAAQDEAVCHAALERLEERLPEARALGELGLDFFPRFPKRTHHRQWEMFRAQLALSRKLDKPLVLHLVRCHHQALQTLKEEGGDYRGIVHAFTGSLETARAYTAMGLLISIGGAVTRQGFRKLKNAVSHLPLHKIVIESDAPDMRPAGFVSDLNEPASIRLTAEAVAELRGTTAGDVLEQSKLNLMETFDLELEQ